MEVLKDQQQGLHVTLAQHHPPERVERTLTPLWRIELPEGAILREGIEFDMAVVDANRRRFGTVIRARAGLDLNTAPGDVISAYWRLAISFPIASVSQRR